MLAAKEDTQTSSPGQRNSSIVPPPSFNKVLLLLLFSCKVVLILCNPMDCVACPAPLTVGFSRQECWSGLPFPSPGDLQYGTTK